MCQNLLERSQVCWLSSAILTLARLMQERHELETNLGYLKNLYTIINSLNDGQYPSMSHNGDGPMVMFHKHNLLLSFHWMLTFSQTKVRTLPGFGGSTLHMVQSLLHPIMQKTTQQNFRDCHKIVT